MTSEPITQMELLMFLATVVCLCGFLYVALQDPDYWGRD